MFGVIPLSPAYGRDYKNVADIKIDFDNGKDFLTPSGRYINKSDIQNMKYTSIEVRYNRLRSVTAIKVN